MAKVTLTARVTFAWWWRPYVYGVAMTCWLTGLEPDWQKVYRMADKAIRIKIDGRKA
ncbi:hypothetical protein QM298_10745 [Pseudomonas mendocina]|nr:hypothetical protein [Pseudomonas mendocina]MDV5861385.1 hypothetical protein [Pseudomonas mendocina]